MKTEAAEPFETLVNLYTNHYIAEYSEIHNTAVIIFICILI